MSRELNMSIVSTTMLSRSSEPFTRYHLLTNPQAGGTPIMLRVATANAAMVHGIFRPMPLSWLTSVRCEET